MKKWFLLSMFLFLVFNLHVFGKTLSAINIVDLEFQIGARSEKVFTYNFAAGDTLVINAYARRGGDISEISVMKWPNSVVFNSYASPVVEKKIFLRKKTTIVFRLKNTSMFSKKTYNLTISRIPSDERSVDFNTEVKWVTVYDSTYVPAVESTLVKQDTVAQKILNINVKLNNKNGYKYTSSFNIPRNTVSWAFWIGVGPEAVSGLSQMVSLLPKSALMKGITDPVSAYALRIINSLYQVEQGSPINYYFVDSYSNAQNFLAGNQFYQFKEGSCVTDYAIMDTHLKGSYYLCLANPDYSTSKYVTAEIVAVVVKNVWDIKNVKRLKVIEHEIPDFY